MYSESNRGDSNDKLFTFEVERIRELQISVQIPIYRQSQGGCPHDHRGVHGGSGAQDHGELYRNLGYCKMDSLECLVEFFDDLWKEEYTDAILINKAEYTADNYRETGAKFISDYYHRYHPFDQMTILGLETQDLMDLGDGNRYSVRIDKLACIGDEYYVCDYKTDNKMKTQQIADEDRQLAMYSKWVKDNYGDAKKVHLMWHMLRFDKDVVSERTYEQMCDLIEKVKGIIKEIEGCTEWPTNAKNLCNWCVYKSICPEFVHEEELSKKDPLGFKDDEGVKLVDELVEITAKKKENEKHEAEIKQSLVDFAEQTGITTVYGTSMKVSIRQSVKVDIDSKELAPILKSKGIYNEYSMVNSSKVRSCIEKGTMDSDIISLAKITKEIILGTPSKRKEQDTRLDPCGHQINHSEHA